MSTAPHPPSALDFGYFRVSTWSAPADGLSGGDWLESFRLERNMLGISVGDVEGHGSLVASYVAPVRDAIVRSAVARESAVAVLTIGNGAAVASGKLVTSIYARLDPAARILTLANAGHPAPLLVTRDESRFLEPLGANLPLGVFAAYRATEQRVEIPEEALLVFYTDGVTEHERDPIRGERELAIAARRAFEDRLTDGARAISQYVFRSGPSHDDAAILAIRFRPAHRRRAHTNMPSGALASFARGSSSIRRHVEVRPSPI